MRGAGGVTKTGQEGFGCCEREVSFFAGVRSLTVAALIGGARLDLRLLGGRTPLVQRPSPDFSQVDPRRVISAASALESVRR